MKDSLIILAVFIVGVLLGHWNLFPIFFLQHDLSIYALFALMFFVGISVGYDSKAFSALKTNKLKIILIPLSTIIGTYIGCLAVSLLLKHRSVSECMAVGSGFGYYSLSSIMISRCKGSELGAIALVANIIRELSTILLTPFYVKYFGKLAPICSGAATTMDTTLPGITKYSGKEYTIISLFHGILINTLVPFLVTFFCSI